MKSKKIIAALVIAAAGIMFNTPVQAQDSSKLNLPERGVKIGVTEEQRQLALQDSLTLDYIEGMGSRRHDEIMLSTSTGEKYWQGRVIEGFYLGLTAGASYLPTATAFSYIAGAEAGYSFWWGDFAVTGRIGNVTFDGLTYMAPSAFAEARFNLAHWGKDKQHRFYLGARVGYQYSESDNSLELSGEDFEFSRRSKLTGSGLGYGVVMGWEFRQFMGGNRIGLQLAAYTYDVRQDAYGTVNGEQVLNKDITKQGWQVELTLRYSFQFGKKKQNF